MIQEAIGQLVAGQALSQAQAAQVMDEIMSGEATPAQFGAFVTALRIKGETADEIAGMAQGMRDKSNRVEYTSALVDTCGTGGDASGSFNVSTAAAFVIAASGLRVAKHGNRAITSQSGSADVLEALGVKLELTPEQVRRCIDEAGIGFMFAPAFHPAMRFAAGPRREIGIRTVFNILGPLTNPAGATHQLLGVADPALGRMMAEVLLRLGSEHVLVVHGADKVDEMSICAPTQIWELYEGNIHEYTVTPEDVGLTRAAAGSVKGGTAQENAVTLRAILGGQQAGPILDMVLLNAAGALVAGNKVVGLPKAVEAARELVSNGSALKRVDDLVRVSNLS